MPVFATPGPITLQVNFPAGDLTVTASAREDTTVEVTPANRDSDADLAYAASVSVEHVNGTVLIKAPEDTSRLRRTPAVHIVVALPAGSRLIAGTAAGDTRATGVYGNVDFSSASGDLHLHRAAALTAKTASGDVTCDVVDGVTDITNTSGDIRVTKAAGALSIQAVSGAVRVGHAASDVDITSTSGDVTVQSVTTGRVVLNSTSGDTAVAVTPGSAVWLDLNSLTGRVTSTLHQSEEPAQGEQTVEITARSLSGSIAVTRAEAAQ
ncbi:DUF4097 family beta strand repeat-containing protein [Nonomuraea typhae]|uniref:DUF4097 family beta strand repeat-containing protein n=1 Tax=Nonomuraea typhae TaxID=2603600 RepID=UPI0012F8FBBE|nr:DUF4097 family beta strand repeat-containing protein [Nonomuraea typhae]